MLQLTTKQLKGEYNTLLSAQNGLKLYHYLSVDKGGNVLHGFTIFKDNKPQLLFTFEKLEAAVDKYNKELEKLNGRTN